MSGWYKILICSKCEKRLTYHQKMYSGGVCVHCGHDDNSTVCATKNVIVKEVSKHKWWQFWKPKDYIGKDDFSINWLKNN